MILSQDILCIEQLKSPFELDKWISQLLNLVKPWIFLLDEDTQPSLQECTNLYNNLRQQIPYIWILYNNQQEIIAAASLTQVIPLRHAFIHGVKNHQYRKHPMLKIMTDLVFEEAFENLHLYKIKAEFESDNLGALGFCRIHSFTKEAHFKEDNPIGGQRKDVVVYSLFYPAYLQRKTANKTKRRL